jgi:hypothetical protein
MTSGFLPWVLKYVVKEKQFLKTLNRIKCNKNVGENIGDSSLYYNAFAV